LSGRRPASLSIAWVALLGLAACAPAATARAAHVLRIGAIFPLAAPNQPDAGQELLGVTIAKDLANAAGGAGMQIELDVRDVDNVSGAQAAADSLRADGVPAVIGAYSSSLSIAASSAVAADGMVYWESGAVADQLTGRGLPLVFRVGANGADLGGNSGRFVLQQLAPRMHRDPASLRALLVTADDAYAHSVSNGARAALVQGGIGGVDEAGYNPYAPYWPAVLAAVQDGRPDVLLLSSHVPDGISFRRAFVEAGLHVSAFIGTTMAQCPRSFGSQLGTAALGVFASDRPDNPFNAGALSATARILFDRFAAVWRQRTGFGPTNEGIAGFSAAWALFEKTLPQARSESPLAIAAAARTLDLPAGSLPDGAGVSFEASGPQLGQNTRAAAVVEQWQHTDGTVVVWPPAYATGGIEMVPLPA
jgi:branched-chain amino acid transport system substrate-binding protein